MYDETGDPYFPNNIDDYLLKQDDPVAVAGATEFYYLITVRYIENKELDNSKLLYPS